MAASETVRLRLQFDYPPPATPHCTDFWLLVDLNRCRVVTDLISLIRQRFGFSSGALLGLYLEGGLLPPGESARLVRDNDCLRCARGWRGGGGVGGGPGTRLRTPRGASAFWRVKLEEREVAENPVVVSNGDGTHFLPRKAKKRSFKLEEDEETELGYKNSKKHWKRQENNNENVLDGEPKPITNQSARKKNKRRNKATHGIADDDDEETKRKAPKKKEKCDYKKQTKNPKSSKAQPVKEWIVQKCSPPKASPPRNSLVKAKRKGGVDIHTKGSPSSSSESESDHESTSDGLSNVILENPVERHKDYSLLPLLAAAPQVGEKIAFKLLELTSDYSPDVSDYKEGKILSHNPETQQVDIEILSSLPAMKEPGKFDLVYHNENGTEVVEYAVTQEKKITVFWRELIDPRLIVESPSNTSNSEVA
ncbi:Coilin [Pteropus alecto]|uniref:Coilin n=1 Tax=Pteropus alecto TaxID=9402 RepID=L5JTT3_PTEAL|nr:Coilin [Pteropus alecto]